MKEDKIVSDVFVNYLSDLTNRKAKLQRELCELPKGHPDRMEKFYSCYALQMILDSVNDRFVEYTNSPVDSDVFNITQRPSNYK